MAEERLVENAICDALAVAQVTLGFLECATRWRHTRTHNGGYGHRLLGPQAARTTNLVFLVDNQGHQLGCTTPKTGNQHDLFGIEVLFDELCDVVQVAQIRLDGLFLNADSGFDSHVLSVSYFRGGIEANIAQNPRSVPSNAANDHYLDAELYRQCTTIERTNV